MVDIDQSTGWIQRKIMVVIKAPVGQFLELLQGSVWIFDDLSGH